MRAQSPTHLVSPRSSAPAEPLPHPTAHTPNTSAPFPLLLQPHTPVPSLPLIYPTHLKHIQHLSLLHPVHPGFVPVLARPLHLANHPQHKPSVGAVLRVVRKQPRLRRQARTENEPKPVASCQRLVGRRVSRSSCRTQRDFLDSGGGRRAPAGERLLSRMGHTVLPWLTSKVLRHGTPQWKTSKEPSWRYRNPGIGTSLLPASSNGHPNGGRGVPHSRVLDPARPPDPRIAKPIGRRCARPHPQHSGHLRAQNDSAQFEHPYRSDMTARGTGPLSRPCPTGE